MNPSIGYLFVGADLGLSELLAFSREGGNDKFGPSVKKYMLHSETFVSKADITRAKLIQNVRLLDKSLVRTSSTYRFGDIGDCALGGTCHQKFHCRSILVR